MPRDIITIAVVNDNGDLAKKLTVLWVNYLARNHTIKFLQETEEIYFKSLINVLKGRRIPWRIYMYFEIIDFRKKIAVMELNTKLLLEDSTEGEIERANLKDAENIVIVTRKSQLRPGPLHELILHIKGKRRFLRKVVKEPTVIVLDKEKIITNKMLEFLDRRFKNYKIFRTKNEEITRLEKHPIEEFVQPFLWITSKRIKRLFW